MNARTDETHDADLSKDVHSRTELLSKSTFAKNDPKWPDMWYLVGCTFICTY
jgi:hypothetical protein